MPQQLVPSFPFPIGDLPQYHLDVVGWISAAFHFLLSRESLTVEAILAKTFFGF